MVFFETFKCVCDMKSMIVRAQMLRMINAFYGIVVVRSGSDRVFADALLGPLQPEESRRREIL